MATTKREQVGKVTYLTGETVLELHQFLLHTPEEVVVKNGYGIENPPTIHWNARILWDEMEVIVTIGDYILANWKFGGQIAFGNAKGYGPNHIHTYIDILPAQIVDDIMREFAPKF